jgi:rhodanese-related sulfurtransferase
VRGVLRGLDGWGGELSTLETASTREFAEAAGSGAQVLDARAPSEWDTGTIDGSRLLYVPDIPEKATSTLDPTRPVWVACATGFRAGIAASLLENEGFRPVVLSDAGVTDVLAAMSDNE